MHVDEWRRQWPVLLLMAPSRASRRRPAGVAGARAAAPTGRPRVSPRSVAWRYEAELTRLAPRVSVCGPSRARMQAGECEGGRRRPMQATLAGIASPHVYSKYRYSLALT